MPDVISKTGRHPEQSNIGCHPERVPARRDESKDLRLLLRERRLAKILVAPSFSRSLRKGWESKKAIHTAPIAPHERERCRIIPMRLDRRLLRRWRRENLASAHGYRFRFRLRSLLRFFSAFIFASHAASMTHPPAPEKSRKGFTAPPDSPCTLMLVAPSFRRPLPEGWET